MREQVSCVRNITGAAPRTNPPHRSRPVSGRGTGSSLARSQPARDPLSDRFPVLGLGRARNHFASASARAASGTDYASDVPGKWREWGNSDTAYAKDFATLGEQTEFFANLATLLPVLKKHPAYASPMGFELNPYRGIRGDYRDHSPHPIPGHLTVQAFFYYRRDGKVEVGGESPCSLQIVVNSLRPFLGSRVIEDETEGLCFAPDIKQTRLPVHHFAGSWGLTKRTAPLFVPATQERFLNAWIYDTHQNVKKNIGPKVPNKDQQARIDGFQDTLAKLSDAEKKTPTWIGSDYKKLSSEGAPGAKAVVIPNPDFFDPKLPRSAMQVLCVLNINQNFQGADSPPVVALRSMIYKKFDYSALQDLLS